MKSTILTQLRAEFAAAAAARAAAAAAVKAAATRKVAARTEAKAARVALDTAAKVASIPSNRSQALAAKAARREQLLGRRTAVAAKIQPHGWTADLAAAAAAARTAEEAANWTALAKAKTKPLAEGVMSLTAMQMAKAKKAKAADKEADVYSTSYARQQERKALLASIAEYRSAIKWAAKKGRNMALLARLVLKERISVAVARTAVAKLAVKRQPKSANKAK